MKNKKIQLGKPVYRYRGNIFSVFERKVILPSGKKTTFEFCERTSSVSVLACNEKNELLMIREFRHGSGRGKWVWFLPSGRVEKNGETHREAAARELREETGFAAREWQLVHRNSPSNTMRWDVRVFAARTLYANPLPLDDGEKIKVEFVPLATAVRMALDGTIQNEFIAYNIIHFDYRLRHGQFVWKKK